MFIRDRYFRKSNGCIFVFDLTREKTLENISYWINEYKKYAGEDTATIMVANKCDIPKKKWTVTEDAINDAASKYGIEWMVDFDQKKT